MGIYIVDAWILYVFSSNIGTNMKKWKCSQEGAFLEGHQYFKSSTRGNALYGF